ncbi:5-formyltetrahydrofolate cyclo-ligase [Microvirga flavescens]|uniref:5-formyltetrahydrofolate cyclo-ligase n=1 Tax=Microvirga flavescens TaxID=2249811 RepID=UPI000DD586D1|nr:5-formyltetrahydrofolate cyclo-ligase [Microvirga flavescens]
MTSPSLAETKEQLRREALARRDGLDDAFRQEASHRIAERALALPELQGLNPVGAYWPIRSEVDPRPLIEGLIARGQEVALPQMVHPHLSFRLWRPGDVLMSGSFGVHEPGPDAPEVFPTVLLMPLAAFDHTGGRIGYGKGYYDRAIAMLEGHHPLLTIGLAFGAQGIAQVPAEDHDRSLDIIVTENETIRPGSPKIA